MRCKPKKSLGQNFLIDKSVRSKIIQSCAFHPTDTVLEIGAGRGELTRLIAQEAAFVYALEIDKDLCKELKNNCQDYKNVEIICQDILRFDINAYFLRHRGKIKIFGNLPYYITSPIIEHLFGFRHKIEAVFITVQKEFAQRILAVPGGRDYGSFSCFVKYYSQPKKIFYIRKGSFFPVPKVDSCFLQLLIRKAPAVCVKDETLFFKIIRLAFNQRRKTLRNSLKQIIPPEKIEFFLKERGLEKNIRPERLGLDDFAYLANMDKRQTS
jgi:16S rRNA (adenine1518-N6/adenine1519-N6)-dimethyltransferase